MADSRHPSEMNDGELEIKADEFDYWLRLPITREFRRRVLEHFDHQKNLLASQPGSSIDRFLGRAEVLDFIERPYERLFED